MARTKGGPKSIKRRKNILSQTKGFRHGRSTKKRAALEALKHAGKYAFRDRKNKKRTMRALHITRLNAALRANGVKNYSSFIGLLKKKNVILDRKVLSELAQSNPEALQRVIAQVS